MHNKGKLPPAQAPPFNLGFTMKIQDLLPIELPIIQAPMAGVQGTALAAAVSNAGGPGSLPCAMLNIDAMRRELAILRAQTSNPINVNFFCHRHPVPDPERDRTWRISLAGYYREFDIDSQTIVSGPCPHPFSKEAAEVLEEFRPEVVSFHFGLPSSSLLQQVKAWRAKRLRHAP